MTQIISESPITLAELKEEIDSVKKRDKEPNIRVQKTEDYLNQFMKKESKKSAELKAALIKLDIPRLKEQHIVKIVDLTPETVDDLKLILQGYTLTISNDNLKKIVEVIKKFA